MAEEIDNALLAKEQAEKALAGTSSLFGGGSFRNKQVEIPEVVEKQPEKKEEPEKTETVKVEAEKSEDIETPLMKIKVNQEAPKPETPEEMLKAFNIKTGMNIEKWEDIAAKADDIAKLKADAEKSGEIDRVALGYKSLFENAPADLKRIVIAYSQEQDYRNVAKALLTNDLDFTKNFKDYEDKTLLVKKYNSEITSDEEWEELDEKSQKVILKATENAYNTDKNLVEKQNDEFQKQREKQAEQFVDSIEKSMKKVVAEYPDMKKPQLDKIRERLSKGLKDELLNEDGVYKEDAGEKIAMMAFGKETIFAMKSSIESRIQKEAKAISDKRVSEELELMNRNRTDKIESTGAERKPNEAEKVLQRTQSFLGSNTSQFKNKTQ